MFRYPCFKNVTKKVQVFLKFAKPPTSSEKLFPDQQLGAMLGQCINNITQSIKINPNKLLSYKQTFLLLLLNLLS